MPAEMSDFLVNMAFSTLFTFIKSLQGPKKKQQFKSVFLKLYQNIKAAYADDPDFT